MTQREYRIVGQVPFPYGYRLEWRRRWFGLFWGSWHTVAGISMSQDAAEAALLKLSGQLGGRRRHDHILCDCGHPRSSHPNSGGCLSRVAGRPDCPCEYFLAK
jgi:hypothetical protein